MAKMFDPVDIEALRPLLPFCFLVENSTGGYLAGLTVLYQVPDVLMPTGKPYRITISMRTDVQIRSRMGAPGKIAFMSPVMQRTLEVDGTRGFEQVVDGNTRRRIQAFLEDYGGRRVDASVDSIIDDNGFLDGPDEAGLLDEVNTKLRAQWDVLEGLTGLRDEQLRNALTPGSAVGLSFTQPRGGKYDRFRQDYLDRLARHLQAVGEASFLLELKDTPLFREIRRRPKQ
jgi:hypothetical protein